MTQDGISMVRLLAEQIRGAAFPEGDFRWWVRSSRSRRVSLTLCCGSGSEIVLQILCHCSVWLQDERLREGKCGRTFNGAGITNWSVPGRNLEMGACNQKLE